MTIAICRSVLFLLGASLIGASAYGCAKDRSLEPPPNAAPQGPQTGAYAPMTTFTMPSTRAGETTIPATGNNPWASTGQTNPTPTATTPPVGPTGTPAPPKTDSSRPPPAALPPASLPPASLTPSAAEVAESSDLFRAQDACLSSCDQFACMKIASAYREGAGLPKDVLAGRRYAIHACLECGKPGPGIERECPTYQLPTDEKSK